MIKTKLFMKQNMLITGERGLLRREDNVTWCPTVRGRN